VSENAIRRVYEMDPGHGWLLVPVEDLRVLGIADRITSFSYVSPCGGVAALEEDVDMATYINAELRRGRSVTVVDSYSDISSRIRTWPSYNTGRAAA